MQHRRDGSDEWGADLARMLRSWDVLGVYRGESVPPDDDEYDDLVEPIFGWLRSGAGPVQLSTLLVHRLTSHYGLPYEDDMAELDFTRHIHAWWMAKGGEMFGS